PALKNIKESGDPVSDIKVQIEARDTIITTKKKAGTLTSAEKRKHKKIRKFYTEILNAVSGENSAPSEVIGKVYNGKVSELKESTEMVKEKLHNGFEFLRSTFGDESNEMLVFVTKLTLGEKSAAFLRNFGSADYDKYNSLLMVSDRKEALRDEILKVL
ncbi:MAG: hypothetical protein J6033_05405, partial [Lachnospiraceae bacterium]|nr:hypothetical protein [Lachnospiraceae bacterium]